MIHLQSGQPIGQLVPFSHCGGPLGPGPSIWQHCCPALHAGLQVGTEQVPFAHIEAAPEHWTLQPPQLRGSLPALMQAPEQHVRPPAHTPLSHALFPPSDPAASLPASTFGAVVPPHAAERSSTQRNRFMCE